MLRQTTVTVAVATLLGIAAGGLVFWKIIQRRKGRTCTALKQGGTVKEQEKEDSSEDHILSFISSPLIPWVEKILEAKVLIISEAEKWNEIESLLKEEVDHCPVLGIDCEWVSAEGKKAKPVSLLQMASFSGLCILLRLPQLTAGGQVLPKALLEILADGRILKVGVGCWEDACKLLHDYGVTVKGTVDLRYLAMRQSKALPQNGLSLKSLAERILNYSLDKSLHLCCSNWEAEQLTQDQIAYAARDAQVSVALFLHLLRLPFMCPVTSGEYALPAWEKVLKKCQGLVDVPFKGRNSSSHGDVEQAEDSELKQKDQKPLANGQSPANQQTKDPRKHKRKPLGAGYSARKSPLYDNCFLHAPDGQPLCTCDRKKAQWYLDKGIGELISTDPFIVKLQFEPAGRPESKVDYYLTVKENLCVVCGKRESYIRKNIVPHEYRKHFPIQMKDHNSHDVLLLCTTCHAVSNYHDNHLKLQLAEEFGAPLGCEEGVRLLEDPIRRQVRSGARALLNADSLPDPRKEELLQVVKDYFNSTTISPEMLQEAAGLETRIFNESYVPHGLKVVQCFAQGGLCSLMQLERRWRQHFLDVMQPKHLPKQWSVDHNHDKLIRKYGEDLQVELS
ncbi:exonuclease 3'-5' domain-containing protein 2 [Varanus komodoensis]|uniref:Exonuclease 3'-5' domain-containing protein 2 n=1 Tax=Varanus komodoensis TaxID=61221 RepID=A0A8D2IW99_VARKO|nr:exonuclease 3'-5' domain-containing protein 2 [Varanus komodoensis]XP_044292795.1 exonuclease 3'-5' domain-containing protein 2 [Varanus komodoensis]XP_044292796.1 exonuclease 3'-5' domain-containing protein 2 [Varanus komodoensis]XP_044292797.1 exonuclease 3'-5' domain-containing protein 2 [Varanus komodoensis]XP_044292798.1 exonuclease 3'-5' domain-containing protein 2 [Varanus komodoensis]XP_044292799.1 exonuclease 3'-5' domain-containing protein 2 [Varanus komodoensis]XP_044292800.1 ex